eukprot:531218-Pyramimonas_sp.AAC.1
MSSVASHCSFWRCFCRCSNECHTLGRRVKHLLACNHARHHGGATLMRATMQPPQHTEKLYDTGREPTARLDYPPVHAHVASYRTDMPSLYTKGNGITGEVHVPAAVPGEPRPEPTPIPRPRGTTTHVILYPRSEHRSNGDVQQWIENLSHHGIS